MLSRIKEMAARHYEAVGMALFAIGLGWILIVAGLDECSLPGTPILPLVIKIAAGLVATAAGAYLIRSREEGSNESAL